MATREIRSVMTRKGQVTVPADVRKALGLARGDKLAFVMDNGSVRIEKAQSVTDRTAGALPHAGPFLGTRREKELIAQMIAEEAAREGLP